MVEVLRPPVPARGAQELWQWEWKTRLNIHTLAVEATSKRLHTRWYDE